MPWLRVDDRMYANKKMLPVSNEEIGLWLWAMDYSADQLTDGVLQNQELQILAAMRGIADWERVADALVAHRLFEKTADGYIVHDYLDYNPTAERVAEDRRSNAARQADYQAKKKADTPVVIGANAAGDGAATNPLPNDVSNAVNKSVPYPSPYPVPGPVPEPKKNGVGAPTPGATAPPLSATAEKFLEIMGRKRFKNATQYKAFEALEAEVGPDPIIKAATWAAENGIPNFDSFRTRARNIASGTRPTGRNGTQPRRVRAEGACLKDGTVHYFRNGRSLCEGYSLEEYDGLSSRWDDGDTENCEICTAALRAQWAKSQ